MKSELIAAAMDIANWTAREKVNLLQDIASQLGNDSIRVSIPGFESTSVGSDGKVDIASVGGVVIFQEFLQTCANLIEETGQTLGLSDKEVKQIKQLLGMV